MDSNRGAVVDAVCPRCDEATVPTGERLITCRSCAMVFVPRDVQRPSRAEPVEPTLPDPLTSVRSGDALHIQWPFDNGGAVALASVLFGWVPAVAAYYAPANWTIAIAVLTGVVCAYFTVAHFIGGREIVIEPRYADVTRPTVADSVWPAREA